MPMLKVALRNEQLLAAIQTARLPAALRLRNPDVALDDLVTAVYCAKPTPQLQSRDYDEIDAPAGKTLQDKNPIAGRGCPQFVAVDGPPAACSELLLKRGSHVRNKKVFRELHLQRQAAGIASIRDEQIDASVSKRYPNVDAFEALLNERPNEVLACVNREERLHLKLAVSRRLTTGVSPATLCLGGRLHALAKLRLLLMLPVAHSSRG